MSDQNLRLYFYFFILQNPANSDLCHIILHIHSTRSGKWTIMGHGCNRTLTIMQEEHVEKLLLYTQPYGV